MKIGDFLHVKMEHFHGDESKIFDDTLSTCVHRRCTRE